MKGLLKEFKLSHKDVVSRIESSGKLEDEDKKIITDFTDDYTAKFIGA
jgi:hypothetical protein